MINFISGINAGFLVMAVEGGQGREGAVQGGAVLREGEVADAAQGLVPLRFGEGRQVEHGRLLWHLQISYRCKYRKVFNVKVFRTRKNRQRVGVCSNAFWLIVSFRSAQGVVRSSTKRRQSDN